MKNSNSVYFAWIYSSRIYLNTVLGTGHWALNASTITMKAREIKRLQLRSMDKNLTSLPRRNQWSQKQCWPFIWRPWVLKITDNTDLKTFWISVISMTELRGLRAWSKFLRGSRREGIMRFYAPLHCFRSSHCCLSTKAEEQIIIFSNDLLFHFSQLLFHLLKTVSCSKTMERPKSNIKTICLILVY